ncbi:hypothetical protein GNF86_01395 [Clostridium perfringens]
MENIEEINNSVVPFVDNIVDESLEEQLSFFKIKKNHSFNETNLMTLPFISLKRKKIQSFERSWTKSSNEMVSIKVVGGEEGVPQIFELDVLLALFRIHLRNNKNGFYKNKITNKTDIPARIYFTYLELSKEVGYSRYSGKVKMLLERSIKKLNETTIYNKFAIYDAEEKNFVAVFKGEKSCRILKNYASYSKEDYKRQYGKLVNPHEVKEMQYVEIDDFFLINMCNNYYKIYDYEKYKSLKLSVAKKIFLILSTWSKNDSKFLTYQTLADYIGLDYSKSEKRYTVDLINRSMKELVDINFIEDFEKIRGEGVKIVFNKRKNDLNMYKDLIKNEFDLMAELRRVGIDWDEMSFISKYTTEEYLIGVLKSIRYKQEVKGEIIKDVRKYFLSAFNFDNNPNYIRWDVREFL